MTLTLLPSNVYRDPSVVDSMSDWQVQEFMPQLRVNKFMPHWPHPKQEAFLLLDCEEAGYGGAAGGGKSDALLMGGLQYVDVPGYSGVLIRRKFTDLQKPDMLIPRSHQWLGPWQRRGCCQWHGDKREWQFESGAVLGFGYLNHDNDLDQYQGGAYQYVGFDELTQFEKESWYLYLFSRMRALTAMSVHVPMRMRSATNPGGRGEDWVHRRFIAEGPDYGRVFVHSKLEDNPSLDQEGYESSLRKLNPTTYLQLRKGIWGVKQPGTFFRRIDFPVIDVAPPGLSYIRSWDLAATKEETSAWTAGGLAGLRDDTLYIADMRRLRGDPGEVEAAVKQTAELDGRNTHVWLEQEGGSGGVNTLYRYIKQVLIGWAVHPFHPRQDKLTRATPLAGLSRVGGVKLVSGHTGGKWIGAFLNEYEAFPNGWKDQVDCISASLQVLTTKPAPSIRRVG